MIVRTKKDKDNPYVMIRKTGLEDPKLSLKAKGLLAYLLCKPDNWQVNYRYLATIGPDGESAIRASLSELEQAGYLHRDRQQDANTGKFEWEATIFETPSLNPHWVEPETAPLPSSTPSPGDGQRPSDASAQPCGDFPRMEPCGGFPGLENPGLDNPGLDNRAIINNKRTKNERRKNEQTNKRTASKKSKRHQAVRSSVPIQEGAQEEESPLDDDELRTYQLLIDEEVGVDEQTARTIVGQYPFEYVLKHVMIWLSEMDSGKVRGTGALLHRLKSNFSGRLTEQHRHHPVYRRHAKDGPDPKKNYIPDEYADIIIS